MLITHPDAWEVPPDAGHEPDGPASVEATVLSGGKYDGQEEAAGAGGAKKAASRRGGGRSASSSP